jgi:phosphopantothenoylcysteine synthetase/decarboxylase
VLYLVVCAAPPASDIHEFVGSALDAGWDVYVIATPQATKFMDAARLEALTHHVVVSEFRLPSEQSRIPTPDAIVIAPATFNTINKWAQGIADTYAVGILCEYLGTSVPLLVVPYMKRELARHPALVRSLRLLKRQGVEAVKATPMRYFDARVPWESVSRHLTMATADKRAK